MEENERGGEEGVHVLWIEEGGESVNGDEASNNPTIGIRTAHPRYPFLSFPSEGRHTHHISFLFTSAALVTIKCILFLSFILFLFSC